MSGYRNMKAQISCFIPGRRIPQLRHCQRRSRHSTDTVSKFHSEEPQPTGTEGLAQGPYVANRAGVETMTLRTKGVKSTNRLPRPTTYTYLRILLLMFKIESAMRTHLRFVYI